MSNNLKTKDNQHKIEEETPTPSVIAIIPARYASQRLPGKPLLDIAGKPMIVRVYENIRKSSCLNEVIVATDDSRILNIVEKHGGKAVMTSPQCKSGTDRIIEVARNLPYDIVVNVQGDEPMIKPEMINSLVEQFIMDKTLPETATMARRLQSREEFSNPNCVKVVMNHDGYALYFSRAPIPYSPEYDFSNPDELSNINTIRRLQFSHYKHIGIYAFRKNFLLQFSILPKSTYESIEKLEQLRILENGYRIKVIETPYECISVDTEKDYQYICNLFHSEEDLL